MINCIIIDDDPVSITLIKHFVEHTVGLNFLDSFSNSIDAVNYIRKNNTSIDLLFLDIEMPEITGFELLESLANCPPVILITSHNHYAAKAFEHKVIHYLVKPIEYSKFLNAIERRFTLESEQSNQNLDYIFIKENGVVVKIMHQEILFCEALGDFVKLHLKGKAHTISSTMKNLEIKLKKNSQFIRVHRSYMINLAFLKNFDTESCYIAGQIIPIGNTYKANLHLRLNII